MYYFTIHNLSSFSLNMNDIVLQESQVLLILIHTKYSNQTWMTITSNVAWNVELERRWCIAPKHFFTFSKFLKYRYTFCTIIQLDTPSDYSNFRINISKDWKFSSSICFPWQEYLYCRTKIGPSRSKCIDRSLKLK